MSSKSTDQAQEYYAQINPLSAESLTFDFQEADRFLQLLDPNAQAFTFQTFDDKPDRKNKALARILHGSLIDYLFDLPELNSQGAGVFVTINETDLLGRKTENIVRPRAIWQDDDEGFGGAFPIEPSIVVQSSPGKFQRYWLVDGLTFEEHEGVIERMVIEFGCDAGAKGLGRVLRLPGLHHRKGAPFPVKIVGGNVRRYSREEVLGAFPPLLKPEWLPEATVSSVELDLPENVDQAKRYLLGRAPVAVQGQGGDNTTYKVCAATVRDYALSEHMALKLLTYWNERCTPPWTIEDLQEKVDRALRYGRGSIGSKTARGMFGEIKPVPQSLETPAGAQAASTRKSRLVFECLAEKEPEPLDWAWLNRLARGKLNLIGGLPGLGKSQLLTELARVITTGGNWPTGEKCRRGSVLLMQGEDGVADTVLPRALAAGVDVSRFFHTGTIRTGEGKNLTEQIIQLSSDLGEVEMCLEENPQIDTLMIDAIGTYLGKADSHKDAEVRAVLTPLASLAERRKIMVIAVAHLNKSNGRAAADRIAGSAAFVQVHRTSHMVVSDPEDSELRIFQPFKRNIGKGFEGLSFRIVTKTISHPKYPAGIETSCVAWEGAKTVDLDEALSFKRATPDRVSKLDEAVLWLRQRLSNGPVPADVIKHDAEGNGIRYGTLINAKKELGVVPIKQLGQWAVWEWSLPVDPKLSGVLTGIVLPGKMLQ